MKLIFILFSLLLSQFVSAHSTVENTCLEARLKGIENSIFEIVYEKRYKKDSKKVEEFNKLSYQFFIEKMKLIRKNKVLSLHHYCKQKLELENKRSDSYDAFF